MSTPTTQGNNPTKVTLGKRLKGVQAEFKKVVWPTKKELVNYTIVVFAMSIFFMACLFVFDSVFHSIINFLITSF